MFGNGSACRSPSVRWRRSNRTFIPDVATRRHSQRTRARVVCNTGDDMHQFLKAAALTAFMGLASTGTALAWGAIAVDHDFGEDPEDSGYVMVAQHHASREAAAADALA